MLVKVLARQRVLLTTIIMMAPLASAGAELAVRVTAGGEPVANAVVLLRQPGLAADAGSTAVMDQKNYRFEPFVLPVAAGAPVSFPNSDNVRHHVYSFSPTKRFELRLYSGTPSEPVVFDRTGIVTLGCNIHDWMLGFIYVTDAPRFGVTDAGGSVRFTDIRAAAASIVVWHPRMGTAKEANWNPSDGGALELPVELGPPVRHDPPEETHISSFSRRKR